MHKELFDQQRECLDLWFRSGSRGIVSAVTGGGKTVLAGIVVSSSRAVLQRVQRLGRILRRKQSPPLPAKLYYLCLGDGVEEARPVIPLTYNGGVDRFQSGEYEPLAERVLAHGRDKKITPVAQLGLLKSTERCLPRGNFCLAEELCLRMRAGAEGQPKRNYRTAALLLARNRLGRL